MKIDNLITIVEINQLAKYQQLLVGFSGGLDSMVLLYYLATNSILAPKIRAIHVNHGLSLAAYSWQEHCQNFCNNINIPLIIEKANIGTRGNIEEAARIARYKIFAVYVKQNHCLLLAHNKNDQAETLLLHLMRGAGINGLAAMKRKVKFGMGELRRPFLPCTRQTLATYANLHQLLNWVEDESNQDLNFTRNYIRHKVLPILQLRWPQAISSLARTASHCQQGQENLLALAHLDYGELNGTSLNCDLLINLQHTRIINILRAWLINNNVKLPSTNTCQRIIAEVLLAAQDAQPEIKWDKYYIKRYHNELHLLNNVCIKAATPDVFWSFFPAPIFLAAIKGYLMAMPANEGLVLPAGESVEIRFRRGGELFFFHGQTKKLKKLFQDWQVAPWLRNTVPLIYINKKLASVVGYAISDHFYQHQTKLAYQFMVTAKPC